MREIKFRAWDNEEKVVRFLDIDDAMMIELGVGGCLDLRGQFTGLLDKNGKEVYEGDIVQRMERHYIQNLGEVVFMAGMFGTLGYSTLDGERISDKRILPLDWVREGLEVIGNIYENPELLKGGV